jgi:hypothetical protein
MGQYRNGLRSLGCAEPGKGRSYILINVNIFLSQFFTIPSHHCALLTVLADAA